MKGEFEVWPKYVQLRKAAHLTTATSRFLGESTVPSVIPVQRAIESGLIQSLGKKKCCLISKVPPSSVPVALANGMVKVSKKSVSFCFWLWLIG